MKITKTNGYIHFRFEETAESAEHAMALAKVMADMLRLFGEIFPAYERQAAQVDKRSVFETGKDEWLASARFSVDLESGNPVGVYQTDNVYGEVRLTGFGLERKT